MASMPLQLPPLRRQSMAQLIAKAKDRGMPPEDYARQLIEDGLALQHEAESKSFAEIMKPVRRQAGAIDEAEMVSLVSRARRGQTRRNGTSKKR